VCYTDSAFSRKKQWMVEKVRIPLAFAAATFLAIISYGLETLPVRNGTLNKKITGFLLIPNLSR